MISFFSISHGKSGWVWTIPMSVALFFCLIGLDTTHLKVVFLGEFSFSQWHFILWNHTPSVHVSVGNPTWCFCTCRLAIRSTLFSYYSFPFLYSFPPAWSPWPVMVPFVSPTAWEIRKLETHLQHLISGHDSHVPFVFGETPCICVPFYSQWCVCCWHLKRKHWCIW